MVGKTYLRYTVGPQGGSIVSNEALTIAAALGHSTYGTSSHGRSGVVGPGGSHMFSGRDRGRDLRRGSARGGSASAPLPLSMLLFLPSLEAVRVYSLKSGVVLHTLIPAELKMPVEVTALQLTPISTAIAGSGTEEASNRVHLASKSNASAVLTDGWMLTVGYSNGYVAIFSCSASNNYGQPVCLLYALGHKIDTKVLSLAVDTHPGTKTFLTSAGQDTDVVVWDLVGMEAVYRLRGHRGGITGIAFVPRESSVQILSRGALDEHVGVGVHVLVTAAADGWLKVWDLQLRQCLQTIVACDTQITAMYMDTTGSRLYCGMRENIIKVYNVEALTNVVSGNAAGVEKTTLPLSSAASTGEADPLTERRSVSEALEAGIVPHGHIMRRHHKPITFISASHDGKYLLAGSTSSIEVFRVNTTEEVKKKWNRKKKRRQRSGQSKEVGGDAEGEMEEEEESGPHRRRGDDGRSIREEGYGSGRNHKTRGEGEETTGEGEEQDDRKKEKKTDAALDLGASNAVDVERSASEEVTLLRTFFLSQKVRSACFLPPSSSAVGEEAVHIAVAYRNNDLHTYTTSLTTSDLEGASVYRLSDLKLKFSFTTQGHQNDIRALCFADNDCALLSMSKEKIILWAISIKHDQLEENNFFDSSSMASRTHDLLDEKEANVQRPEEKGALAPIGEFSLPNMELTAMDAIHSTLCCAGQADGSLLLVDLAASVTLFAESSAHVGAVKHVRKTPDKNGFLTVGEDRRLLSWTIGLAAEENEALEEEKDDSENEEKGDKKKKKKEKMEKKLKQKNSLESKKLPSTPQQPTILLAHEIELAELPLFVECSIDMLYIGVGFQNHQIQLFFGDTLKPYLSLFGHKLPPTAISFSTDSTLVASVGMDKSLRFWGTDFGDCHRAIHAHDEYITDVKFITDTHYAFTVSLDGVVKQWDGDRFHMIQMFRQHVHGLWSVAATINGTCVVAAGVDKSIRCFFRTDSIVFPQEEEERMAHEAMEEEAARNAARARLNESTQIGEDGVVEVAVAGHATSTTAEAAEKLMSALDLISVEQQRRANPDDLSPRHPLLTNKTEWEYLWSVMESIRTTDIRHALHGITSVHVDVLLDNLLLMLDAGVVLNFEIAAKFLLALVMPAPGLGSSSGGSSSNALRYIAIAGDVGGSVSNGKYHGLQRLEMLRHRIFKGLDSSASMLDYNIAGLQLVRYAIEENEKIRFFDLSKAQGYKKKYHSRAL